MNPDGSEPERRNPGVRRYAQGDPVFATTLRVTPNESDILQQILKSHENKKTKDPSKGTGQSGPDLQKIRRNEDGIPVFTLTHKLTPEEAEVLKTLLETQDKSGGGNDPSPEPSAPPEGRDPPYAPGYQPQGPYGPPGATGPPPGYGPPGATGYTGGAGGYGGHYAPGGYPPQGPSAPPGATGPYGQQGATGYTPPEGQGPTDPGDDPSGPSDPSGLPTKGKGGEILVPLETKDTESSNSVEVLEYKIPGSGGKHRKHKAKEGFGFNVVTHGNTEVWTMSDSCHATDVTVIGVGKPSKKMDIKLSNGTRKRFGKGGKNKPWKPEVEKK